MPLVLAVDMDPLRYSLTCRKPALEPEDDPVPTDDETALCPDDISFRPFSGDSGVDGRGVLSSNPALFDARAECDSVGPGFEPSGFAAEDEVRNRVFADEMLPVDGGGRGASGISRDPFRGEDGVEGE